MGPDHLVQQIADRDVSGTLDIEIRRDLDQVADVRVLQVLHPPGDVVVADDLHLDPLLRV